MNTFAKNKRVTFAWTAIVTFTLAAVSCTTLAREPGIANQPSQTAPAPSATPTAIPLIDVEGIAIQEDQANGVWNVFGLVQNVSDDGLADIELRVALLAADSSVQAEKLIRPALRQIAPGDVSAFQATFTQVPANLKPDQVLVELETFQVSAISPLQIAVSQLTSRPNFEGGTTFHGYFSNMQTEFGELQNIEAYTMDENGKPIDSADLVLSLTSIEPRGRAPFRVDFYLDQGNSRPEFFIDAVPVEDPSSPSPLWTVSEPRLYFTSQGIPYYLMEIENSAFAPQQIAGILSIREGFELVGILPVRSPAPIPAQSSWFFTLEPALALPLRFRTDRSALQDLTVEVTLDPLATRGVGDELTPLDLQVEAIEMIGGSLYLQGKVTNPGEQDLVDAVIYATVRNTSGQVVSAASELVGATIPAGISNEYTLSLRIPEGTEATALEFDLTGYAIKAPVSSSSDD